MLARLRQGGAVTEKADVQAAVSESLRAFSVEVEQYISAASGTAAIHRTDLTALSHAMDATASGTRMTPGELAARMGLSPSATTSMLDRLEAAGHVVRSRDSADRRVVTVSTTDHAQQVGYQIFAPLAQALDDALSRFSMAELAVVQAVLEQVVEAARSARPHR